MPVREGAPYPTDMHGRPNFVPRRTSFQLEGTRMRRWRRSKDTAFKPWGPKGGPR